ncbi:hypothetical protein ASPCAL07972 [Aspergillus calidoustus]|uniref:Ig-like domain-containing protein n=1 Tax=Aspergillus calidoustus TaxID=454130 RepID=A0A0U5GRH9_ASPCI|nr:hypothetical protein ASPCAL07972 [Aspergillus calidoustus]
MNLKHTLLVTLSSLAYLVQSSPVEVSHIGYTPSQPEAQSHGSNLEARREWGVWLDVYKSGDCSSGWESQPTSGWLWTHQCKNIESYTYGARLGTVEQDKEMWPFCKLKFWERPDCHGHATVTYIQDTEVKKWKSATGEYKCIATANKGGQFYLSGGASSVELICEGAWA